MRWLRNPRVVVPAAAVLLAGAAWLTFGYFAVHLIWVDDKVDEALPTFDASAATSATPAIDPPTTVAAPGSPPTTTAPATTSPATTAAATTVPATNSPMSTAPATTPVPAPEIVEEASGTFVSLDHDTSGRAVVLGNGTAQRFLRFEDFSTSNGPDVNVYLVNSAAGGVTDFVDLGNMKGNVGDQNYEIPAGLDVAVYDRVLIWCVRFASPFGEAFLA